MEAAETSVEPQIRYKPGPRSRKHKLIVKETEKESESIAAGAPKEVNTVEIVETEVRSTNQTSPKRKADTEEDLAGSTKKAKPTEPEAESVEAIEQFIKESDTVMEVAPAPPNQEAVDRRRAKRPYQVKQTFRHLIWVIF